MNRVADELDELLAAMEREHARRQAGRYLGKRHASARHYRKQLAWRAGDPCMYCNGPRETWDHLESKKRGGVNRPENLGPACRRCNSQKHAKPLLVFLAQRRAKKLDSRQPAG